MSSHSPIIHTISVKNFKSLKETGVLKLKPITLLVGPNSSGKTALLQTILVLKQTLESRNIETPLVLRGRYVNLGSFKEVVFGHNVEEVIEISLGIDTEMPFGREPRYRSPLIKIKIGYDAEKASLISKGIEFSTSDKINLKVNEEKLEILQEEKI